MLQIGATARRFWILTWGLFAWSWNDLPVHMWILSGYFDFRLTVQKMAVMLIVYFKLPLQVCVCCVLMGVCPLSLLDVMDWQFCPGCTPPVTWWLLEISTGSPARRSTVGINDGCFLSVLRGSVLLCGGPVTHPCLTLQWWRRLRK